MQYIKRRGDVYFAYQGTTKTGKPKYFASKKPNNPKAALVAELPTEFEFFQNPMNATVVIRRRKQSLLAAAERNLLARLAVELCCVEREVVIDGNAIVVCASPTTCHNSALEAMMPGMGSRTFDAQVASSVGPILINPLNLCGNCSHWVSVQGE